MPDPTQLRYYDFSRHWTKRIVPHLADQELNEILVRDFNRFTYGTWRKRFKPGDMPHDFESCDWWLSHKGPMPRYWKYVKHSACHALVNFNLRLASLAEPGSPWRILTSDEHSTVWDGGLILFDLNFSAMGIEPSEAFALATAEGGRRLRPGKYRRVYMYPHWSETIR